MVIKLEFSEKITGRSVREISFIKLSRAVTYQSKINKEAPFAFLHFGTLFVFR